MQFPTQPARIHTHMRQVGVTALRLGVHIRSGFLSSWLYILENEAALVVVIMSQVQHVRWTQICIQTLQYATDIVQIDQSHTCASSLMRVPRVHVGIQSIDTFENVATTGYGDKSSK